ncbi:4215_t:CDS:1, partial [Ambispora leptoticha]
PNILYQETDESINLALVDFDWAGEAGKVSYPSFLNIQSVKRHPDARSDKVITPEHDIFSLNTFMMDL